MTEHVLQSRVSVAMATFNGARYIEAQLMSIESQTIRPDEIVICDDGSSDKTLEIVEDFTRTSNVTVRIFRNSSRLGFAGNFSRAIGLCTGDIIFLSDQDDYWTTNKIETVLKVFRQNSSCLFVIHDAIITDPNLKPSGLTLTGQLISAGRSLDEHIQGCCMALKREFVPLIHPVPVSEMGHDGWINRLAVALGGRYLISDVLLHYRRHENSASSSSKKLNYVDLFAQQISLLKLDIDPISACEIRIEHMAVLTDRLTEHAKYIEVTLSKSDDLRDSLLEIELQHQTNIERIRLLSLGFVLRAELSTRYYFQGFYKNFGGVGSMLKDIFSGLWGLRR